MVFKKYAFRRYDKSYPILFAIEKTRLKEILPKDSQIEHVGSTAVKGLGGKGMIDIAISVNKKELIKYLKNLEENGYVYKPKFPDKERKYLERRIIKNGKERRIHLHLTNKNSYVWKEFLIFRDVLRNNEKIKEEYSRLKKKALIYSKGDGKKYLEYKQPFIRKIIEEYKNEYS